MVVMSDKYTTQTASIRATIGKFRKLDADKMLLNGKNILDYIGESSEGSGFDSYDTRDPQLKNDELDIWNTKISLSEEGHIEVKPHIHSINYNGGYIYEGITESQYNTLKTAVKVVDGEVLGSNDAHIMYWQTDGMTAQNSMFYRCSALTAFSSDLSSLTDGNGNPFGMFESCTNLTTFTSNLPNMTNGKNMFMGCASLTEFSSELPSLTNGGNMFSSCTALTSFTYDLPNLTDGSWMFSDCTQLSSFSSELPSLQNGTYMFNWCSALTSFSFELPNLTNGNGMFIKCSFTTFTTNLPNLTDGHYMFYNCSNNLKSFSSELPNLTNGEMMFYNCSKLTSFSSNLPSLTKGNGMFSICKLDAKSVANIIHTIKDTYVGGFPPSPMTNITIGIGCDNTEADKLLFAQECDCETWQELLDEFSDKNWTVDFQFNGRPTEATTYNMRRGETLPVYTKLEEVIMPTDENERKPHYSYTSADGSKFYNIHYFHSTNGSTEGYDVFSSLDEAISTYNVTPKN